MSDLKMDSANRWLHHTVQHIAMPTCATKMDYLVKSYNPDKKSCQLTVTSLQMMERRKIFRFDIPANPRQHFIYKTLN